MLMYCETVNAKVLKFGMTLSRVIVQLHGECENLTVNNLKAIGLLLSQYTPKPAQKAAILDQKCQF